MGKEVSPMKYPRHGHCNVLVNDRFIYVIGNYDEIEVYDIINDSWSVRGKIPEPIGPITLFPSCSAIGSVIYVYHTPSLYKYNTESEEWQEIYTEGEFSTFKSASA